jgi:hypothetical protein
MSPKAACVRGRARGFSHHRSHSRQHSSRLSLAALGAALLVAPLALHAQDSSKVQRDTAAKAPVPAAPTAKASNGEVAAPSPLAALISAVGAPGAAADQIKGASENVTARLVDVGPLTAGDAGTAFAAAADRGRADLPKLQAAIAGHAALSGALKAASVDPTDVVAADVGKDGTVTVYYHKK